MKTRLGTKSCDIIFRQSRWIAEPVGGCAVLERRDLELSLDRGGKAEL
jgi:hypothetical protein